MRRNVSGRRKPFLAQLKSTHWRREDKSTKLLPRVEIGQGLGTQAGIRSRVLQVAAIWILALRRMNPSMAWMAPSVSLFRQTTRRDSNPVTSTCSRCKYRISRREIVKKTGKRKTRVDFLSARFQIQIRIPSHRICISLPSQSPHRETFRISTFETAATLHLKRPLFRVHMLHRYENFLKVSALRNQRDSTLLRTTQEQRWSLNIRSNEAHPRPKSSNLAEIFQRVWLKRIVIYFPRVGRKSKRKICFTGINGNQTLVATDRSFRYFNPCFWIPCYVNIIN